MPPSRAWKPREWHKWPRRGWLAHFAFDGDIVFVMSLGAKRADLNALGIAAAEAVARAIARGVTQARSAGGVPGLAG